VTSVHAALGARALVITNPRKKETTMTTEFAELFIDYRELPQLAELTDRFHAVDTAYDTVTTLVAALKRKRGERINSRPARPDDEHISEMLENIGRNLDEPLTRSRERAFEAAKIRVELANSALFRAIRELHVTIDATKEALATNGFSHSKLGFEPEAIAQNNVVSALELADVAAALYYETVATQLNTIRWSYFAISRTYKSVLENGVGAREWVVMASGHGSSYRFGGADPNSPPPAPYQTLAEAIAAGRHWEGIADTIGGGAQVYNVRTKETRGLYQR
jgi:hypothetical protein